MGEIKRSKSTMRSATTGSPAVRVRPYSFLQKEQTGARRRIAEKEFALGQQKLQQQRSDSSMVPSQQQSQTTKKKQAPTATSSSKTSKPSSVNITSVMMLTIADLRAHVSALEAEKKEHLQQLDDYQSQVQELRTELQQQKENSNISIATADTSSTTSSSCCFCDMQQQQQHDGSMSSSNSSCLDADLMGAQEHLIHDECDIDMDELCWMRRRLRDCNLSTPDPSESSRVVVFEDDDDDDATNSNNNMRMASVFSRVKQQRSSQNNRKRMSL